MKHASPRPASARLTSLRWATLVALWVALLFGATVVSCSAGDPGSGTSTTGGQGAQGGAGGDGGTLGIGGDIGVGLLELTPQDPVITVVTGMPVPTVQFEVTQGGMPVAAAWHCDRGEIALIDDSGLLTPTGNVGGVANVEATVAGETVSTTITVKIETVQNGSDGNDPPPGSGGWGGVGGEGVGPAIDAGLLGLLNGATTSDPAMAWLYPYDNTVFPLGVLPPLLMWSAGIAQVADAVYVHVSSANYDYKGYFGRPPTLPPGAPFVRHPIPPAAWQAATQSSAGGPMTVQIVVAAGGTAYGPITETWTIAAGVLKGTVYYQSYGTNLAKNYGGAIGGDGLFGGATLAIEPGSAAPVLVAGQNGGTAQCRVCHSVSMDGSRMIVQHGDAYAVSSSYDLQNGFTETPYGGGTNGNLGWIGMMPDGSKGLGNRYPISGDANPNGPTSELFDLATGALIPTTGLTNLVSRAGLPAFSGDGAHVAFNFFAGPGDATIGVGDQRKLVAMDFDDATNTFSNPRLLYSGSDPAGWPSFLPTNDAVVFQVALPGAQEGGFATRYGGKGQLWWVDLATGTATPLAQANGTGYLPVGPNNHGADHELNYEPTVSPIASGGYAWVVFMSRRMYGSVATIDPWASDPREHDLFQNITTKKLWVAAVDLNAPPGTDPSHPAFYLPGQEILAGNARGFWVNDPCKPDGESCETGDECCGGFCQPDENGNLVCGQMGGECSEEFEACDTSADCCDPSLQCINGVCTLAVPN